MKRRVLSLLVALCLIIGLLPPVVHQHAHAVDAVASIEIDGAGVLEVTEGGEAKYTVNTQKDFTDDASNSFSGWTQTTEGADAENWNVKFVWNAGETAATLYLKGAKIDRYNEGNETIAKAYATNGDAILVSSNVKIVITGEDSYLATEGGITSVNDANITISSEGAAKLVGSFRSWGIVLNEGAGHLHLKDANLEIAVNVNRNANESAPITVSDGGITIDGGNVTLNSLGGQSSGIHATNSGNIIINSGVVNVVAYCTRTKTTKYYAPILAKNGNITINGGAVTAEVTGNAKIYCIMISTGGTGSIIINGGSVTALNGYNCFYNEININGGYVEARTTSSKAYYAAPNYPATCTVVTGATAIDDEINVVDVLTGKRIIIITPDHTLEAHEAVEPQVGVAGNTAYWSCSVCGKYFCDEKGYTAIEENSWVLEALPESPEATDPEEPECEHTNTTKTEKTTAAATCGKAGSKTVTVTCDDCGEVISTTTAEIPATGEHSYGDWVEGEKTCGTCGDVVACEHTNTTKTEKTTAAATCGKAGSKTVTVTCDECSKVISTDTVEIPATGEHSYGDWVEGKKTCGTCSDVVACEHTNTTKTEKTTAAATCGKAGSKTVTVTCDECSKVISTDTVEIPATGEHSYGDWVEGKKTCGTCSDVVACEHTNTTKTEKTTAAATCGKAGSKTVTVTCDECSKVISTDTAEIPATGEHSYDSVYTPATVYADAYTTYTCSACGDSYVETEEGSKLTAVAKIGDDLYETLAKAVAAANDKDTIELLASVEGNGVVINKSITIDFGGNTYTIVGLKNDGLVGSAGTETLGFQILKNNTVTLTNGTLEAGTDECKMLIQNYANLTLNNITVDGTGSAKMQYVLSNNSGEVALTGATNITAPEGAVAFDVCKYSNYAEPNVTVNTTGTITGEIEVTGGTLKLEAAIIDGELDYTAGTVNKAEAVTLAAPADYKWVNGVLTAKNYVAQIGESKYETLADAVAAANDKDTIELLASVEGNGVVINKSITIDFGGNTYTIVGLKNDGLVGSAGTETLGFQILKNNTVTLTNGTLEAGTDECKMLIQNYANLTLNNITVDGTGSTKMQYVLSNNSGEVALTGATNITAPEGAVAFDVCKYSSYAEPNVTVNTTGTITGEIEVTGGTLKLEAAIIDGELDYTAGTVNKAEAVTLAAPADYKWVNGVLTAKNYVAQIGESKYETLADAVAAANDKDTIELLASVEGNGVVINKSITIDFGGNTYTIVGLKNDGLVGSAGTETLGFQILKNNTVTLTNGTLEAGTDECKMLIQNYANLTLNNITVDGTGSAKMQYVLSNNSGEVALTGATNITAPEGAVAFDVCKYSSYAEPNVTVNTTGTITGEIEVTGGTLKLEAAIIDGELDYTAGTVNKAEAVTLAAPADYKWVNGVLTAKNYVAQIGESKYETLADAVAAANDKDTIELLASVEGNGVVINKSITIDFGGNTYTIVGLKNDGLVGSAGTETLGFQILKNNTVTLTNGTLEAGTDECKMLIQNYANLTLNNITVDGTGSAKMQYVLSNNSGEVALTGATNITAPEGAVAFDVCKYSSYAEPNVTVNTTGTITGEIEVTGGTLKLEAAIIDGELDYTAGTVNKAEAVTLAAPADYKWVNGVLTAKNYVAQIGESKYETLADAVAAANDKDTIELLASVEGNGVVINKSITIDFGGNTYTIVGLKNDGLVGSAGTETLGFQILKNNTVTLTNGTLEAGTDECKMLIQNYANLTLNNITVDGTGSTKMQYVLSNNSGEVALTGATNITAPEGAVAFDVCKYSSYAEPNVTVNTTGTITGEIEVTGGTLKLEAAIIDGELDYTAGTVNKAEAVTLAAPADYKWVNGVLTAKNYVAQIGESKYETLAEAIAVGGEVKLLADIELKSGIVIESGKNITIDLAGYDISLTVESVAQNTYLFHNKGTLTITDSAEEDGEICLTYTGERTGDYSISTIGNNGVLNIEGGIINCMSGNQAISYAIDAYTGGAVNISGGTVCGGASGYCIRVFLWDTKLNNTLNITGGTVQYIWVQNSNANANKATLNVTGGTVSYVYVSAVSGKCDLANITLNLSAENMEYAPYVQMDNNDYTLQLKDGYYSIEKHEWIDATCSEPKTCAKCGATEGEALGHNEEIIPGKDATCTETGLTEGKKCSVCGEPLVAQETVPAKGHSYDNALDTECNNGCGTTREIDTFTVENNKVVISTGATIKEIVTLSVFYGVDGTVADLNNWDAVVAVSEGYKTYEAAATENVVLFDGGTYILRLRYLDENGTIQLVSIQKTVAGLKAPEMTVENGKVIIDRGSQTNEILTLTVFYGVNGTASDLNDWGAVSAISAGYRTYEGAAIEKVALTENGTYILRLRYTDASGATQTISIQKDVTGFEKPEITVEKGKVVINQGSQANELLTLSVFYGVNGTASDLNDWGAVSAISAGYRTYEGAAIKKVALTENGTYILRLRYTDASEVTQTLSIRVIVTGFDKPEITVEGDKIKVTKPENVELLTLSVFYGVEETVADLNNWDRLIEASAGYKTYIAEAINDATLPANGGYILRLRYTDAQGNTQVLSEQIDG